MATYFNVLWPDKGREASANEALDKNAAVSLSDLRIILYIETFSGISPGGNNREDWDHQKRCTQEQHRGYDNPVKLSC